MNRYLDEEYARSYLRAHHNGRPIPNLRHGEWDYNGQIVHHQTENQLVAGGLMELLAEIRDYRLTRR